MFYNPSYCFEQQFDQTMLVPLYYPLTTYATPYGAEIFSQNFQIFSPIFINDHSTFKGLNEQTSTSTLIYKEGESIASQRKEKTIFQQNGDSEYCQPEERKKQHSTIYKNKNTETNLANQIFSYLSCSKSQSLLRRLFNEDQKKMDQFYSFMKKVKKLNKKYLNRKDVLNLITFSPKSSYYRCYLKSKSTLEVEELKKVLRIAVGSFFESSSRSIFLTSKKMNRQTLMEHLKRIRQFKQFIFKSLMAKDSLQ